MLDMHEKIVKSCIGLHYIIAYDTHIHETDKNYRKLFVPIYLF